MILTAAALVAHCADSHMFSPLGRLARRQGSTAAFLSSSSLLSLHQITHACWIALASSRWLDCIERLPPNRRPEDDTAAAISPAAFWFQKQNSSEICVSERCKIRDRSDRMSQT
jgi:hypothetical protein